MVESGHPSPIALDLTTKTCSIAVRYSITFALFPMDLTGDDRLSVIAHDGFASKSVYLASLQSISLWGVPDLHLCNLAIIILPCGRNILTCLVTGSPDTMLNRTTSMFAS